MRSLLVLENIVLAQFCETGSTVRVFEYSACRNRMSVCCRSCRNRMCALICCAVYSPVVLLRYLGMM